MTMFRRVRAAFGVTASVLLLMLVALSCLGCAAQGDAGEGDLSADPTVESVANETAATESGFDQRKARALYSVDGYFEGYVGFSEDGKYIVTDYPALIDAESGKVVWEGKTPSDGVKTIPNGREITAGSYGTFLLSTNGMKPDAVSKPDDAAIEAAIASSGQLKTGESLLQRDPSGPSGTLTTSIPYADAKVFVSTENILVQTPGSREGSATGEILIGLYDADGQKFEWLRRVPAPQYASGVTFVHLLSGDRVMFHAPAKVAGQDTDATHTYVWGKDSSKDWSHGGLIKLASDFGSSRGARAYLEDNAVVLVTPGGELFAVDPQSEYFAEGSRYNNLRDGGRILAMSPDGSQLIEPGAADGGEGFTVVGFE